MSDILVIGGGVIGLLTARELAASGADVTLVEMGETGRESSWAGGGIISPLYPWRYDESVTALARWSQAVYPELCATLRDESGIDPEYIATGMLILDEHEQEDALSWAATHGAVVEIIDADAAHTHEPGLGLRPKSAMWLPEIAQVRNPRLTKALRRSIEREVRVREHEEVVELLVDQGRAAGARTRKETIHADKVVVCTGAWTAKLLEQLGTKPEIEPVRGQIMLFFANPGQVNHIGSTLEHTGFLKTTTAEAKEELYRIAVEMFPLLRRTPIENHWAGLRPGSPSGIPYIGSYPGIRGLYFNAGHFRNGLVTGPASARLVADLVLTREPVVDPAPYALEALR